MRPSVKKLPLAIRLYPESRNAIGPHEADSQLAWALLGNDDDGIFGEKTSDFQGELSCSRALACQLRNPLHNFCFYVIGSADRCNDELDLLKITKNGVCIFHYHPYAKTVFADQNSSLYLGLHGGKPFFSLRLNYFYDRQLDFYFGWREKKRQFRPQISTFQKDINQKTTTIKTE